MLDLNDAGPQHGERTASDIPSPDEAKAQFREAMRARGIDPPDDIEADGEIQRCDTTGRNGDNDASYVLHLDGFPAGGFQNWQDGRGWENWHVHVDRALTPGESAELQRKREADRAKREAARTEARAHAAERAVDVWDKAIPEPEHPYLHRKGIKPHGVRLKDRTNFLAVPMFDDEGTLQNLQLINVNGEKRFLKGGLKAGTRYVIGDPEASDAILIGEGFATCATAHEATERAVVVAFDGGNLLSVATSLRAKFPSKHIVMLADDDWRTTLPDGTPCNTGQVKAHEAATAVDGWLAIPQFNPDTRKDGDTDFNDVACLYGIAVAGRQIFNPRRVSDVEVTLPAHTQDDVEKLIATLDPSKAAELGQISTITMALKGIVSLRLNPVVEDAFLKQIKARGGVALAALRGTLAVLKSEVGIKPVSTPASHAIERRYVFVKQINAFWDRDTRTIFTLDAVRNAHYHEMPPSNDNPLVPADPIDVLIRGDLGGTCHKVDVITFVPGEKEIIQEDDSVALNIWTKPDKGAIEGDDQINAQPFVDHLLYILDGEQTIVDYVLDFLAHLVQKPADKIKITLLIIGDPGIGKSMIGEMMCELVGEANTTAIEESDLTSTFNEWMDGVQLVLVHELMTVDKRAAMNRLKSYITDLWLRINRKNVPTYKYRNRVNFVMFSNYDDAAKIEKGDRRYLIWKSKAKPRDKKYYAGFRGWFNEGGAERLLHFLQHRDLSKFDPNAAPPETAGKRQVIEDSRDHVEAYLQDAFDAAEAPFRHDLVTVRQTIDWLAEHRKMRVTHKQVSMFLRSIGAEYLDKHYLKDGTRPQIWAIRDAAEWLQVGTADIKEAWRDIPDQQLPVTQRDQLLGRVFGEPC